MSCYRKERKAIDAIDRAILKLLARRGRKASAIGRKKGELGTPVRDGAREQSHLAALQSEAQRLGMSRYHVAKVFREIVGYSVEQQETEARLPESAAVIRVAHLGIEGSNTHSAAARYFGAAGAQVKLGGCPSLRQVFETVLKRESDYGVVPVENTTAGSINEVYDLLYRHRLWIVGEVVLPIEHCLLALEDVAPSEIREVVSHPQALAQCADFLSGLGRCRTRTSSDTATAAKMVSEKKDRTCAAIASSDAAAAYNLKVVRSGLANQRENYTRFLVIAREPAPRGKSFSCKTSVVFSVLHETGSLEKCLHTLCEHGINMTKLESRPRPHVPWEYVFYVDFEGAASDGRVKEALEAMEKHTCFLRVLGSYPATGQPAGQPAAPVRANGAKRAGASCAIVEKKPYRLASRRHKSENTVVRVGGAVDIGARFTVIAGPCAVESREQMRETALSVRQAGAELLRGGVYKPRSSPYSFQGLGEEGLAYLWEAGKAAGLPTVTEVMEPSQVQPVAAEADMLQVGARNMQNFPLLCALGEIDRPVLLKRSMMASIDELLLAAEYIMAKGNKQVVLCERGIRTFETATRNTLDLSAVVVLKERTHLPVIVDPSHAVGVARWVAPLAKAALACGADGIMVEVHPSPQDALCDARQALSIPQFEELMRELAALRKDLHPARDASPESTERLMAEWLTPVL